MRKVACIGVGNIGRAWAICFARGGVETVLYDEKPGAAEKAVSLIEKSLDDLFENGSIKDVSEIRNKISVATSLEAAVNGVDYVQESIVEDRSVKRQLCEKLDAILDEQTIVGSSSSEFMSSEFAEDLTNSSRYLNAHPFNPPYLIPVVEICGHAHTSPDVVTKVTEFIEMIGMTPICVKKEIKAFIVNRLQVALYAEALHLVGKGYVSATDLDKAIEQGPALRWAFMGPFMTSHLNASHGYSEYMRTFSEGFKRVAKDLDRSFDWDLPLIDDINTELSKIVAEDCVEDAQRWRDKRLMALLKHKSNQPQVS